MINASGPYTKGAPGGIDTAYPWVYGFTPARTELRAPWRSPGPSAPTRRRTERSTVPPTTNAAARGRPRRSAKAAGITGSASRTKRAALLQARGRRRTPKHRVDRERRDDGSMCVSSGRSTGLRSSHATVSKPANHVLWPSNQGPSLQQDDSGTHPDIRSVGAYARCAGSRDHRGLRPVRRRRARYEVVWARQLVLVFGNTTQAVSAILTGFFAGMAIGASSAVASLTASVAVCCSTAVWRSSLPSWRSRRRRYSASSGPPTRPLSARLTRRRSCFRSSASAWLSLRLPRQPCCLARRCRP